MSDHKILKLEGEYRAHHRNALIILDFFSHWIQNLPGKEQPSRSDGEESTKTDASHCQAMEDLERQFWASQKLLWN